MTDNIYLDYNATTPVAPEVAEAMISCLHGTHGNPSSSHRHGQEAKAVVDQAREQVAACIGCGPSEIVFTSGGTESNNLAIFGVTTALEDRGRHLVTCVVEHPAILEPCRRLEEIGWEVTRVKVGKDGIVDPEDIRKSLRTDTVLVTIMHANNEVGSIQPISEIGRLARERNIVFHSDAAQSVGKIPVNVNDLGVDLLSLAGHKIYAPAGIGALYVKKHTPLKNVSYGAGQEGGLRPGTEPVALLAGLGRACELISHGGNEIERQLRRTRDQLQTELSKMIPDLMVHGHRERRLPNTLSVAFPRVKANALLAKLPTVEASAGSACHSGKELPSGVLKGMGIHDEIALWTVRLSTGRETSPEEITRAVEEISGVYAQLLES